MSEYSNTGLETQSSKVERRKYSRIPLRCDAFVSSGPEAWYRCTLMDASLGGAQILTHDIDPWSVRSVQLKFTIVRQFALTANIVWHVAAAHYKQRIGLSWTDLDELTQPMLGEDIEQMLRR